MEKARIFVANDDKVFMGLMKDLLEDEGYDVKVLEAASHAYEEIVEALPDLLILDITLEHPDVGWVVLNKIKLNPKTAHIPVIICSANVMTMREREEYLNNLGCFVTEKPFDIDTLLKAVKQALETPQSVSTHDNSSPS